MNSFRLDSSVPTTAFQFIFTNPKAIPKSLRFAGIETPADKKRRENNPKKMGELVIGPLERCSVGDVIPEYHLTDASYQIREGDKGKYYVVRFVFIRGDQVKFPNGEPRCNFRCMLVNAVWTVKVFSNPFYLMGEAVEGKREVEVSLVARKPLVDSAGQPIKEWRKDEHGRRAGDGPVPIRPDWHLRVKDGNFSVVKVCNGH